MGREGVGTYRVVCKLRSPLGKTGIGHLGSWRRLGPAAGVNGWVRDTVSLEQEFGETVIGLNSCSQLFIPCPLKGLYIRPPGCQDWLMECEWTPVRQICAEF